jgi:hypothetical protein
VGSSPTRSFRLSLSQNQWYNTDMGFYVEVSEARNKVEQIKRLPAFIIEVDKDNARDVIASPELSKIHGVIVVTDNGFFEAAAFAYDLAEFDVFAQLEDLRPKRYLLVDREWAEQASGYKKLESNNEGHQAKEN